MDTNSILSADLLDLVFDQRNKEYGAYELRRTYHRRVKKAMAFTGGVLLLTISTVVMAGKLKPSEPVADLDKRILTITEVHEEIEPPKPLPEPKPQQPEQVQAVKLTTPKIVDDIEDVDPLPTVEDIEVSKIADKASTGVEDTGIQQPQNLDDGKNIIAGPAPKPDEPVWIVEIEAKYTGDWRKFLLRNLNPQVGVDNGAPAGNYSVLVQFVVDVDGSVSDIRALTSHGYGFEQEALRVLRKASKWEPAFQNGHHVKAYRKQTITFQVGEGD